MEREKLGSRLGFILLWQAAPSAAEMYGNFRGCADSTEAVLSC